MLSQSVLIEPELKNHLERFKTYGSGKLDRSCVNGEGVHRVAPFSVPLLTIIINSYDLVNCCTR